MANLNKVLLLGNVTRDPEVRYTPKGSAVCDLGVAVNRAYTTDSGEKAMNNGVRVTLLHNSLATMNSDSASNSVPTAPKTSRTGVSAPPESNQ